MLEKLIELKKQHIALQVKAANTKTTKAREKVYDQIRASRRLCYQEAETIDFNKFDLTKCNIMAMVGGPYHIESNAAIKIEENLGVTLQVSIDGTWAGRIYLLDNPCGIDNLAILAAQNTDYFCIELDLN
jgi:hypothetical protein